MYLISILLIRNPLIIDIFDTYLAVISYVTEYYFHFKLCMNSLISHTMLPLPLEVLFISFIIKLKPKR